MSGAGVTLIDRLWREGYRYMGCSTGQLLVEAAKALETFAKLGVVGDRLIGLDPDELCAAVAALRDSDRSRDGGNA